MDHSLIRCYSHRITFLSERNQMAIATRKKKVVAKKDVAEPVAAAPSPSNLAQVKWAANHHTAQIYSSGVEVALCSDDNEQIGPFVFCKDFFQDAIVAFLHKTTCSIYGYSYDPSTMPACPQKELKVLIADSGDAALESKIPGVLDLLNQVEKQLGVTLTTIHKCEKPPEKYAKCGIFLMVADKIWMHAPPLLSMWTLLARNGLMHKPGEKWGDTIQEIIDGKRTAAQKNDKVYLTFGKPGIDLVMAKGITAVFGDDMKNNYPKGQAGHTMHHWSGIVSFGSCKAKKHFPKWEYPATETNPPGVCFS